MKRTQDRRGNNVDRRARKVKLLKTFGDGTTAPCTWCLAPLTYETVTADRIDPQLGYRFCNVVPACQRCNSSRGNEPVDSYVKRAPNPEQAYKLLFSGVFG